MSKIVIDPWTEESVMEKVRHSFEETMDSLVEDVGIGTLSSLDYYYLAELFYTNGYIHGAMLATSNTDFRDDIDLMNDEIEYQKR